MPRVSQRGQVLKVLRTFQEAECAASASEVKDEYTPLPRIVWYPIQSDKDPGMEGDVELDSNDDGFLNDDMFEMSEEESNLEEKDSESVCIFNRQSGNSDLMPALNLVSPDLLQQLESMRYWQPRGPYLPTAITVETWFNQPRFTLNNRKF